jgi:hypothetical protein
LIAKNWFSRELGYNFIEHTYSWYKKNAYLWMECEPEQRYAMGSPPIAGLKKPDAPNLSVYIITMAAEKVGIETIVINDVMSTAHTNNGIFIVGLR